MVHSLLSGSHCSKGLQSKMASHSRLLTCQVDLGRELLFSDLFKLHFVCLILQKKLKTAAACLQQFPSLLNLEKNSKVPLRLKYCATSSYN